MEPTNGRTHLRPNTRVNAMIHRSTLIVLFLVGCAQATAEQVAIQPKSTASTQLHEDNLLLDSDWRALTWDGAQGTQRTLDVLAYRFEQQTPARQAELVASARSLVSTCPYNRAVVQLILALNTEVARHDAHALNEAYRNEFLRLQTGLKANVDLFETLGVADLPLPEDVSIWQITPQAEPTNTLSPLMGRPELLQTRGQVEGSETPLADMEPLLAQIEPIVNAYTPGTKMHIDVWRATLTDSLGEYWPWKMQLIGWRNTLERIRVHAREPGLQEDIDRMVDTIDRVTALYC